MIFKDIDGVGERGFTLSLPECPYRFEGMYVECLGNHYGDLPWPILLCKDLLFREICPEGWVG